MSVVFPAVPILSTISLVLCLLILPSFWKTRIFALVYYLCWIILGNVLLLINTCVWRGSIRNIPVYSDLVAQIWNVYTRAYYMCILCVSKFIWVISKPAPSIRVYDERKRTNLIDTGLCVGLPLVWMSLSFLYTTGRYLIFEDLGPWPSVDTMSIDGFVLEILPVMVTSLICAGFSSVACYNFLLSAHQNPPSLDANLQQLHRVLPSSQRWKYTLMSAFTICGGLYGAAHLAVPYAQASYQSDRLWYKFISFISSDINYQHVFTWTKEEMNLTYPQVFEEHVVFAYSLPLIGILVFSLFGLGPEIRRVYVERMRALEILLTESRLSSWLKTQVSKVEWRRLYHRLISSMLSCVGRLNDVRIAIQGAVVDRWPGRRQVDPNQFTPFRTDDIILDDFLAPLNSSGRRDDAIFGRGPLLPLSPPTVLPPPPAASSSKRQPVLGPTWREYRKGPLPGTVVHGEVNEDFQRQPGTSTKAAKRSMQPRPAYVVYRKGSL